MARADRTRAAFLLVVATFVLLLAACAEDGPGAVDDRTRDGTDDPGGRVTIFYATDRAAFRPDAAWHHAPSI